MVYECNEWSLMLVIDKQTIYQKIYMNIQLIENVNFHFYLILEQRKSEIRKTIVLFYSTLYSKFIFTVILPTNYKEMFNTKDIKMSIPIYF